jgi:glutathione S-transferase
VQRTVAEGLMVETVQVFDVRLPDGFMPVNRDGEVAAFEALPIERAVDAIERGEFTLQSSMAILDALRRGAGGPASLAPDPSAAKRERGADRFLLPRSGRRPG